MIIILNKPFKQAVEMTQLLGDGFCKYLLASLHTVHFELSFPTVHEPLDITPI